MQHQSLHYFSSYRKVKTSKDTDEDLDNEYFAAAHAMTCCYDLFCKVEKLIKIGCLLQQDKAADKGDLEEDEDDKVSHKKRLEGLSTHVCDCYKWNYQQLLQLAPGLRALINNKSKSKQLARIAQKMNGIISATQSDDSTRLKSQISHYAAPLPAKEPLSLPVNNGTSSRSHLGVNHPVLASFLCPITAVKEYHQDPAEMRKKLASGQILMSAANFPAYLWEGIPPGEKYDEDSMTDGPSTALGKDSHATQSCNMSLHDMTMVQPEHITYACIQAHFRISSKNKWAKVNGKFSYQEFYQNIINFLCECEDKDWVDGLLKWWNRKLFKTENGQEGVVDKASINDSSRSFSAPMDSLAKMRAQMSAHASAAKSSALPPLVLVLVIILILLLAILIILMSIPLHLTSIHLCLVDGLLLLRMAGTLLLPLDVLFLLASMSVLVQFHLNGLL
ncbi:hypothetical protein BD769DRAFT_1709788 [Suillus cothurnatus]|nr:hypothetical protein BD769DRAFT_1709788 [Suillus cothurnatus]